jgi:hypothetical protein
MLNGNSGLKPNQWNLTGDGAIVYIVPNPASATMPPLVEKMSVVVGRNLAAPEIASAEEAQQLTSRLFEFLADPHPASAPADIELITALKDEVQQLDSDLRRLQSLQAAIEILAESERFAAMPFWFREYIRLALTNCPKLPEL